MDRTEIIELLATLLPNLAVKTHPWMAAESVVTRLEEIGVDFSKSDPPARYTLCKHCDHFVDDNPAAGDAPGLALYVHLDDGEKEHGHDAVPGTQQYTLKEWRVMRADLFERDPVTGKIGPNRF